MMFWRNTMYDTLDILFTDLDGCPEEAEIPEEEWKKIEEENYVHEGL